MAKRFNMVMLATLMVVGAIFQGSEAQTTHVVGGSTGWGIPSGGAATYTTWASQQKFAVGDVLVFNFATGTHDVTKVTKAAYDGCTTANPISSITTAPASITLASAGEHYFICTFAGHCAAGQKLTVTVSGATTATPPTATATPPSTTVMPPTTTATPPTTTATPPTTTVTPPTTAAMPPTTTATPPTTTATPPTTTAMPPTTTVMPPSTTSTPPAPTATSPTGAIVPSSQSPSGSIVPPPPSSATSLVAAALPVALLSLALAFLH